ncbi:CAP-associated domain-containing protein [Brevibacillus choshinensis]|uniref:CAP-associated domain-containing protein n=1 Tax=Brevibacillus choshinensis TaxID=54911 RepID=UPI002E1BF5AC|nr:CAP-associated domain-containing protein [Brevibacillus choshinensis]
MRKWLLIGLSVLSIVGISRFFSSDHSSLIRVNIYPSTVYWDGREVASSQKSGANQQASQEVPATLEYKGTLYVPLSMIGRQLNKPVGWDDASYSAWVGQPPAALAKQPSVDTTPVVVPASAPIHVPANTSATATNSSAKTTTKSDQPNSLLGLTLGMSSADVTKRMGNPARKDPSSLGYQWWIYNSDPAQYVQVGIANGKVVDLYSLAPQAKLGDIGVGTALQALERQHPLQNVVTFTYLGANIQITNQKQQRPLVMENGIASIYYLDKQNNDKVTALRLIDTQMLLRGGFYETRWTYQGQAPDFDPPALSVKERESVNIAYERQILDLVNVSRFRSKLPPLQWNEMAAQVARKHSLDMESNDFFDHVSATTGSDPFDRLKQASISYRMAGENIAAGYPDAIEAHESWMNSPGHRKNVLEKGFTQLGVGVITDYYTQTFLTPAQ